MDDLNYLKKVNFYLLYTCNDYNFVKRYKKYHKRFEREKAWGEYRLEGVLFNALFIRDIIEQKDLDKEWESCKNAQIYESPLMESFIEKKQDADSNTKRKDS